MPNKRNKPLWRYSALRTGQIARLFQVCNATVIRWIDTGLLPGFSVPGSRHRRVLRSVALQFAVEHGLPHDALKDPATTVEALAKERP